MFQLSPFLLVNDFTISAPAEPRNQGPPTYANLVKSGPTLVPSQGSLPPAGFTKPSATSPAPLPQTGLGQSGNGGRGDKDAGFAGQGQQGPGKFRPGGRPSKFCSLILLEVSCKGQLLWHLE